MAYPLTPKLVFPLKNYKVNSYKFRQKCSYNGKYWGVHLGEDVNAKAGTKVIVCGRGKVVYSSLHAGSKEKPNWGNIVIMAHKQPCVETRHALSLQQKNERYHVRIFYSLHAHLSRRLVKKGDKVELGQVLGAVGRKNTKENGWWKEEHLHFAIYIGKWKGKVLPGYWQPGSKRTKLSDWQNPSQFIRKYGIIKKN